jgi:hypothetical protein
VLLSVLRENVDHRVAAILRRLQYKRNLIHVVRLDRRFAATGRSLCVHSRFIGKVAGKLTSTVREVPFSDEALWKETRARFAL